MTTASLDGQVVLVTGASSGIGRRFAQVTARAGARVVAAARRGDRLASLVADIQASGGEAVAVDLDVTLEASIEAAFDAAEQRYGCVTGVIANAGITTAGAALDLDVVEFDRVFATNVRGVFLTARAAARRMLAKGSAKQGRIVLLSSITAHQQTNGLVAYSASKAAVTHMGRLLAKEWARSGPNVNVLSPGYIETELAGDWFETESGKRQIDKWPRRRLLDADALDQAMIYFLSSASGGATGAELVIDDGQSL